MAARENLKMTFDALFLAGAEGGMAKGCFFLLERAASLTFFSAFFFFFFCSFSAAKIWLALHFRPSGFLRGDAARRR